MDSGVLGSPLSWAHRGPRLHQQVPGAHLEPSSTGQETQREQAHPCPGKGPCCLGKLSSGWFLVYLLKMIIVFFFIKAPVFAKEKGKLFQWKQDKDFQAGVILASHLESVFLPRSGWLSGTGSVKGSCPSTTSHPTLATLIFHFFLEHSARTREPFPPTGMIFRSGTHSLFFILFSSKGSDIAVGRFGFLVAVLCQTWGWAVDHWLMWA